MIPPLALILLTTAATAPAMPAMAATPPQAEGPTQTLDPGHAWALWGIRLGFGGLLILDGAQPEIVLQSRFADHYWMAVRYHAPSGRYLQVWASLPYEQEIRAMVAGDFLAAPGTEIGLLFDNGEVHVYAASDKQLLAQFQAATSSPDEWASGDFDGDGYEDFAIVGYAGTWIHGASGNLISTYGGIGGQDITVGQMDGDPAPEFAVTTGTIVDGWTGLVEATYPSGFGWRVDHGDVDRDGVDEVVWVESGLGFSAYDLATQTKVWSHYRNVYESLDSTDLDLDGEMEFVLSDGAGRLHLHDGPRGTYRGVLDVDLSGGATRSAAADLDGDGRPEVAFGLSSSDVLVIGDVISREVLWLSDGGSGELTPPESGDLDGDGIPEIVTATRAGSGISEAGRVHVYDQDLRWKATGAEVLYSDAYDVRDLRLVDLDGDGTDEILLAAEVSGGGQLEVQYYFVGPPRPLWRSRDVAQGVPFFEVDAADVDGDGEMEIIGVGGEYNGCHVYVYDYGTGLEEWHSFDLGLSSGDNEVEGLTLADVDGDSVPEICVVVETGDLWVLDGATQGARSYLPGPWTCLDKQAAAGGGEALVLGTAGGAVEIYEWVGGSLQQVAVHQLAGNDIDALRVTQAGMAVTVDQHVEIHSPPYSGTPAAITPFLGQTFEQPAWFVTPQRMVVGGLQSLSWFTIP